jgi:hypothetical protein
MVRGFSLQLDMFREVRLTPRSQWSLCLSFGRYNFAGGKVVFGKVVLKRKVGWEYWLWQYACA